MDSNSISKIYNAQNIAIRKQIRQIDLEIIGSNHSKCNDVNILVVGNDWFGQLDLLKTFFYALNGSLSYTGEIYQTSNVIYERYEIKKNKKSKIEGLSALKETDNKLGITGYVLNLEKSEKNRMQKYSKAAELLGGKGVSCMGSTSPISSINYVLVCCNMMQKMNKQQIIGLKYFLGELQDKKIGHTIVGTQLDKILNNRISMDVSYDYEQSKAFFVQNWKQYITRELQTKQKVNIYCIETYKSFKKEEFQHSEMINYYALNLLQQIIREAEQYEMEKQKKNKVSGIKLFWFCS